MLGSLWCWWTRHMWQIVSPEHLVCTRCGAYARRPSVWSNKGVTRAPRD